MPENFCVFLPNQKAERQRPFGTGLVRHCPQGLFSPFFTFLRAIFSRPFRLPLAPTICPWVSEDAKVGECTIYGKHKNGFKPFASIPLTNVRQVSHSLFFRYQQNLPNLFCSCSQHNRGYFIIIIFFIFACVCFSGQRRQARSKLGAPETREGERRSTRSSHLP